MARQRGLLGLECHWRLGVEVERTTFCLFSDGGCTTGRAKGERDRGEWSFSWSRLNLPADIFSSYALFGEHDL